MKWLSKIYQAMWEKIGGRPWTYIIRDIYHTGEWFIIVAMVLLGVWLGKTLSWGQIWLVMGIFTFGYLAGHLFWGMPYIEGQPGDDEEHN